MLHTKRSCSGNSSV